MYIKVANVKHSQTRYKKIFSAEFGPHSQSSKHIALGSHYQLIDGGIWVQTFIIAFSS